MAKRKAGKKVGKQKRKASSKLAKIKATQQEKAITRKTRAPRKQVVKGALPTRTPPPRLAKSMPMEKPITPPKSTKRARSTSGILKSKNAKRPTIKRESNARRPTIKRESNAKRSIIKRELNARRPTIKRESNAKPSKRVSQMKSEVQPSSTAPIAMPVKPTTPVKPKGPKSSYNIAVQEFATKWKRMTPGQKNKYKLLAASDKERHQLEMKKYKSSLKKYHSKMRKYEIEMRLYEAQQALLETEQRNGINKDVNPENKLPLMDNNIVHNDVRTGDDQLLMDHSANSVNEEMIDDEQLGCDVTTNCLSSVHEESTDDEQNDSILDVTTNLKLDVNTTTENILCGTTNSENEQVINEVATISENDPVIDVVTTDSVNDVLNEDIAVNSEKNTEDEQQTDFDNGQPANEVETNSANEKLIDFGSTISEIEQSANDAVIKSETVNPTDVETANSEKEQKDEVVVESKVVKQEVEVILPTQFINQSWIQYHKAAEEQKLEHPKTYKQVEKNCLKKWKRMTLAEKKRFSTNEM